MSGEEGITQAWLQTVLVGYLQKERGAAAASEADPPDIDDYEITALDERDSALSDLLAIKVRFHGGGGAKAGSGSQTARLVAKLLPQDAVSRATVQEAGFDRREIGVYSRLLPDVTAFQRRCLGSALPPLAPVCYHAEHKPDCESILVLEDLRASGFSVTDFSACLTEERARLALTQVARLHATTFAMRVRDGVDLLTKYDFLLRPQEAAALYDHFLGRGLPHLIDFLKGLQRADLAGVIARLKTYVTENTALFHSLVTAKSHLSAVTHSDFWCNNLLFRDAPSGGAAGGADAGAQCRVIDFQLAQVSTPTNDVALLLLSSLSAEVRRERTGALLRHYWDQLTATARRFGVCLETEYEYSLERLEQDYRRSRKLALLLCAGSVDVTQSCRRREERLVALLTDMFAEGVF
ncbi:uncharacterized protein LOC122388389 [Amphibalanus amphitrite]|uniref:uncharacterized protein LOC122388389 n=1 Tax=Amphibalanus amphitrite TaxID=1232801 RepID=UPI001C905E96|nr:uncharacterized protein LOC122388389 [Amphibalanus amphitrite]XP_043235365.1 uncharacterized protein LOC122388389 [Amphibalanus amphitrite]